MSSPLLLINPRSKKQPISVADLLALLSPVELDRIDQRIRFIRETHTCPATVRDHDEFRNEIYAFHLHYERSIHEPNTTEVRSPESSFAFLRRHFKHDLHTAERNAILGRDGGLIRVLDDLTDSLAKMHVDNYVDMVLWDYVPEDHEVRLRLAEELLRIYGRALLPSETLVPAYVLAANIGPVLKAFAMHIHAIRPDWRW